MIKRREIPESFAVATFSQQRDGSLMLILSLFPKRSEIIFFFLFRRIIFNICGNNLVGGVI